MGRKKEGGWSFVFMKHRAILWSAGAEDKLQQLRAEIEGKRDYLV